MPIIYGLTSAGLVSKSLDVVRGEVDTALQGIVGASAATEPDGTIPLKSMAGQIKVLLSDAVASMWDLMQQVYASFNPASASGASLDAVSSITGTIRVGKIFSTVTATCTGTPGTIIAIGKVASVAVTAARFDVIGPALDADRTIGALSAWAPVTGYTAGDRVTNGSGPARAYVCITSGTSAGFGGPGTTAADITDSSAHWQYLGDGTGAIDIAFEAEVAGPIGALAGTLTAIATPVSGWSGVTNLANATLGNLAETDSALRRKRESEIAAPGNATEKAIQGAVLKVATVNNPVLSCSVFYNDTDITDGNGVPPHSVEAIVRGGSDADVAQALLDSVAAGVGTYGSTSVAVTDSAGNSQTIKFSRLTEVPIYIIANVTYDPIAFPTDTEAGADGIEDALAVFGETFPAGKSVRASALEATIFDGPTTSDPGGIPVPGILDVTAVYIGTAPSPGASTTIPITRRQLATFATANITINLTPGTP